MNYIYDILLNFNKKLYDFYDWNKKDKIIHIRKIPSFKISDIDFKTLKNNIVKMDNNFLQKINYKTQQFKKKDIFKIKYTFLISNGKDIMGIKLNRSGIITNKSALCIDEREEIIEIINRQEETKLKYKIIKKDTIPKFKTRFEIENQKKIIEELQQIYNQNNYKKMSYIYLECYGKTETNIEKAFNKLKKEIIKENDNFYKIYNFFKTINQK